MHVSLLDCGRNTDRHLRFRRETGILCCLVKTRPLQLALKIFQELNCLMQGTQWSTAVLPLGMDTLRTRPVSLPSLIPPLVFVCSALYLLFCKIHGAAWTTRLEDVYQNDGNTDMTDSVPSLMTTVDSLKTDLVGLDGSHISTFKTVRLICCITLVILLAVEPFDSFGAVTSMFMILPFVSSSSSLQRPIITFRQSYTLQCFPLGRFFLLLFGETSMTDRPQSYYLLNTLFIFTSTYGLCVPWAKDPPTHLL